MEFIIIALAFTSGLVILSLLYQISKLIINNSELSKEVDKLSKRNIEIIEELISKNEELIRFQNINLREMDYMDMYMHDRPEFKELMNDYNIYKIIMRSEENNKEVN